MSSNNCHYHYYTHYWSTRPHWHMSTFWSDVLSFVETFNDMWSVICEVSKNRSAFVCCKFHICATLCSVTFVYFARISRRTFTRILQLEQSGALLAADSRRWSSWLSAWQKHKAQSWSITTKKHKSGNWLCVDCSQLGRFHKHKIVSPPWMST